MPAFFTRDTRSRVRQHDSGWVWKFIVRACALVVSMVAIILLAVTASKEAVGISYFMFIPLIGSVLYALITVPLTLRRGKPVHPGVNVTVDLLLWLLFGLTGLYAIGSSELLNTLREYDDYELNSRPCGTPYDESCDPFYDYWKGIARLLGASGGLAVILAIFHFILFVTACIDTHRHNQKRRIDRMTQRYGAAAEVNGGPPPYGAPPAYPLQSMQPPTQPHLQAPAPVSTSHYAPK